MPVAKPENVSCRQYGDWLQVNWSYLPVTGDTLTGFKVKWGLNVLPVGWTTPPAVDAELQGGDGGSPREFFSLLFRISDGLICDWESFETYPLGTVGTLGDNVGNKWDGAWSNGENTLGYTGKVDNFESYETGVIATLNDGKGYDGPWEIR